MVQENTVKMQSIWNSKGEKLHTRNIEVSTYECDDERVIVEGCLKDDRFQDSYTITGEIFPRGVIHHMRIRMLVNCSNFLEDIDVDLAAVPREYCRETKGCLAAVKGLTITRGFTSKVRKLAGGSKAARICWSYFWPWLQLSSRALRPTGHERRPAQIPNIQN